MKLLIVESPGKVSKIQGFLGADWKVAASVGHVRDLPLKSLGVFPPDYKPQYVETDRGKETISKLKGLASNASEVFLATDPDREGEAIAWHLKDALGLKDPHRVTYTEITESAVKKAVAAPRKIDMRLVQAQECRRILDRLVGYKVSPPLSAASGASLSAGRVQSPAVRLVSEREAAIKNFRYTTHFGVELNFDDIPSVSDGWKAVWNTKGWLGEGQEYFLDKEAAARVAALKAVEVRSYEEGEARQAPPAPFTTSTLQQAASNALKLDPKECMALAQKLYEGGHITYMRTDSPNLSDEAVADIRSLATLNDWPVPPQKRVWKSKDGAQEAHEAIRPTHFSKESAGDTEREKELYALIRSRAIACQLEDAAFATVKAVLAGEVDGKEAIFDARGRRLLSPGWKAVVSGDQAVEEPEKGQEELGNAIPKLREGSRLAPASGEVKTKKTSPPPRFTQASLIRELEKRGIGRPSTYAAIMDNIISSKRYVRVNTKRQLESTETGDKIASLLVNKFGFLDYDFTKRMEDRLDGIAEGKDDYLTAIRELDGILDTEIKDFANASGFLCPECGSVLAHWSKTDSGGKLVYDNWSCGAEGCKARFKNEGGKPGEKIQAVQLSEYPCGICGKPLRHLVSEEKGYNYWGCSDRGCEGRFRDEEGKPGQRMVPAQKAPPSGYKCFKCGGPLYRKTGEKSLKTGRPYDFFACDNKDCQKTYFPDADGKPKPDSASKGSSPKNNSGAKGKK